MKVQHKMFVICMLSALILGVCGQLSTDETTTSMDVTTPTPAPGGKTTTTAKCDEETLKKDGDCCMGFTGQVEPGSAEAIVGLAIDQKFKDGNITSRKFANLSQAEKKDCMPPLYNIHANITVTPVCAENVQCKNATETSCHIVANYVPDADFVLRKMDCGKSSSFASSASLMMTLALPVLALILVRH